MNGFSYEAKCARYLRTVGFQHVEITRQSADQGIDIIARRHGIKYGIQCKYYSYPVGNHAIMEAFAGAKYYRCQRAVVMTNNHFSAAASKLAKQTGVILWPECKARLGLTGILINPCRWLNALLALFVLFTLFWQITIPLPAEQTQLCALGCLFLSALVMLLRASRTTILLGTMGYAAAAALLQYSPFPIRLWNQFCSSEQCFLIPVMLSCLCLFHWLSLLQCERIPSSVREKIN